MLRYRHHLTATAMGIVLSFAVPAAAQTSESPADAEGGIADIVVTAEKRAANVQDIAIAISAFTQNALEDRGVTSPERLELTVPGMSFGNSFSTPRVSIRGIGTESVLGGSVGGDPGVAIHADGVVLGRPQGAGVPFFDLERVEVLRGPQGTLYGRNATGGSINIISKRPTANFEGFIDGLYGNLDHVRVRGAISGPLADGIMARFSFYQEDRDAEVINIAQGSDLGDKNARAFRAQLLFEPSDKLEVLLSGDYYKQDQLPPPMVYSGNVRDTPEGRALLGRSPDDPPELSLGERLGGTIATGKRRISSDLVGTDEREFWGVSGRVSYDLEFAELTSITAYRETYTNNDYDLDGTEIEISNRLFGIDTSRQFSQELQLVSSGAGPLEWTLGLYYFNERGRNDQEFNFTPLGIFFRSGGVVKSKSYAAYGQASYAISDRLKATAGLRYTIDKKRGSEYLFFIVPVGQAQLSDTWKAWTPKFGLEYRPAEDVMLYATASRGFKSGGINVGALQGNPYEPEFIWAYEVGMKSRFFDDRLQANISAFYYDYTNLQVNQLINLVATLTNAASSTIKGVEGEFVARPVDGLDLNLNVSYLDATFNSFSTEEDAFRELGVQDLSGNRIARSPKWKINVGAQYTFDLADGGSFSIRSDYAYQSRIFLSEFNRSFNQQKGYGLLSARAQWNHSNGQFWMAAFGNNITDKQAVNNTLVEIDYFGYNVIKNIIPRRSYGVEVGFRF